jgi:hypothetical protein
MKCSPIGRLALRRHVQSWAGCQQGTRCNRKSASARLIRNDGPVTRQCRGGYSGDCRIAVLRQIGATRRQECADRPVPPDRASQPSPGCLLVADRQKDRYNGPPQILLEIDRRAGAFCGVYFATSIPAWNISVATKNWFQCSQLPVVHFRSGVTGGWTNDDQRRSWVA